MNLLAVVCYSCKTCSEFDTPAFVGSWLGGLALLITTFATGRRRMATFDKISVAASASEKDKLMTIRFAISQRREAITDLFYNAEGLVIGAAAFFIVGAGVANGPISLLAPLSWSLTWIMALGLAIVFPLAIFVLHRRSLNTLSAFGDLYERGVRLNQTLRFIATIDRLTYRRNAIATFAALTKLEVSRRRNPYADMPSLLELGV